MIERACLDYIEGFYEGDTAKLIKSLKPSLHKFGYWQDKKTGKYAPDEYMTWRQALDYAKRVSKNTAIRFNAGRLIFIFYWQHCTIQRL